MNAKALEIAKIPYPSKAALNYPLEYPVTVVEDGTTFEWFGTVGFRGLFDGRHRFDLEATPTGTKLTQSESLDGILVRVMRKSLDTNTHAGFEAMNAALKARAEAVTAA